MTKKQQVIITKNVVREMIKRLLEGTPGGDVFEPSEEGSNVSAGVDPSAAVTNPGDDKFRPQNKTELGVAITNITKDLPDDKANNIFQSVKSAIETQEKEDQKNTGSVSKITSSPSSSAGDKNMSKKNESVRLKAEYALRKEIRKALRETYPNYEYYGSDHYGDASSDEDDELEQSEYGPSGKRKAYKDDAFGQIDGGDTLELVAKELGMSIAGAKRLAGVSAQKMKSLYYDMEMNDNVILITLGAIRDYIDFLKSSGELTPADVQFLTDHPSHISELDGFREFLSPYIKKYLKTMPPVPDDYNPTR